eukprot:509494_1
MSTLTLFILLCVNSLHGSKIADAWKKEISHNWDILDHAKSFKHWQKEFNKIYTDAREEAHRFAIFLQNWKRINDHNTASNRNYSMRLNQFGDLTPQEFKYYVHGHLGSCLKQPTNASNHTEIYEAPDTTAAIPSSIDWTNHNGKNYVSPVKNQEHCGSCWAFAATGATESRTAILKGHSGSTIVELSEQQLVDCSESNGNSGCDGGLMTDSYRYMKGAGGLCSELEYPYKAKQGTCRADKCENKYDPISAYLTVKKNSEESLLYALSSGPVSVAVEADQSAFQFYSGGIMDGSCGTKLDHGVLAVGYGTKSGMDYWKVKNSWGASWGEDGYVLICRNCAKNGKKGECGILQTPSFPQPAN